MTQAAWLRLSRPLGGEHRGMMRLRQFEDRRFYHSFVEGLYGVRRVLHGCQRDVWQPPTDVYETDRQIVVKMSIPGIDPGHVSVKCNGEVLTICGTRRGPDPSTVRRYHQMEIPNGYFERRIAIHRPFDPLQAAGRYVDGFLYVLIPVAPHAVSHVVSIELSF
jgi:HSP20 family molecular chaperone IbpA